MKILKRTFIEYLESKINESNEFRFDLQDLIYLLDEIYKSNFEPHEFYESSLYLLNKINQNEDLNDLYDVKEMFEDNENEITRLKDENKILNDKNIEISENYDKLAKKLEIMEKENIYHKNFEKKSKTNKLF